MVDERQGAQYHQNGKLGTKGLGLCKWDSTTYYYVVTAVSYRCE